MVNTEAIIRYALQEAIPITLVVNKIDRLILELRLPPTDAFYKIKHTIEDVNTYIRLVYHTHLQASGTELFVIVA
jgi:U5 small nuclear ribonucleoprotein component